MCAHLDAAARLRLMRKARQKTNPAAPNKKKPSDAVSEGFLG
jgi:hypothetical protein